MKGLRNVCAKFKIDPLNCFCTEACQVFITQKLLPSKIPLTIKFPLNIFSDQFYHLPNFFWNLWCQTNKYLSEKVNIWTPWRYFPYFSVEMKQTRNLQEKTQERSEAIASAATLLKNRLCHRCLPVNVKLLRTLFLTELTPPVAASKRWKIVKLITLQIIFFA